MKWSYIGNQDWKRGFDVGLHFRQQNGRAVMNTEGNLQVICEPISQISFIWWKDEVADEDLMRWRATVHGN